MTQPTRSETSSAASTSTRADRRIERLAASLVARGRGSGVRLERVLLVSGSVLAPLGVLLVLLGWYGASHTPRLFEQIPYLISGGILGAAMVGFGGFCYFGFWLTRILHEQRHQTDVLTGALGRLEAQLSRLADTMATRDGPAAGRRMVATANGTMAHRPWCSLVTGKPVHPVDADEPDLKPCKICAADTTPA